jgi:hypothetical protein
MTAAQKKNVERFKKAAAEAKKLRAKNPKLTQAEAVKKAYANLYGSAKKAAPKKKVGAIKIIEKGENKSAKVTKVLQQKRSKKGTFKGYKTLSGTKTHKDTKSHNVNIRVVSGIAGNAQRGLKNSISELESWQKILDKLRNEYKTETRAAYKKSIREDIQVAKKWITQYKRIVQDHLKNIK